MTIAEAAEKIQKEFSVRSYRRKLRCIDTGREWNSVQEFANEYELNASSARVSITRYGKYGNMRFEFFE